MCWPILLSQTLTKGSSGLLFEINHCLFGTALSETSAGNGRVHLALLGTITKRTSQNNVKKYATKPRGQRAAGSGPSVAFRVLRLAFLYILGGLAWRKTKERLLLSFFSFQRQTRAITGSTKKRESDIWVACLDGQSAVKLVNVQGYLFYMYSVLRTQYK